MEHSIYDTCSYRDADSNVLTEVTDEVKAGIAQIILQTSNEGCKKFLGWHND